MTTIDLTPLYRNSIGFDSLASILEGAFRSQQPSPSYPPYDIEAIEEHRYAISLAVAGFSEKELDINVERGVLIVKGKKSEDNPKRNYLYQGIAVRAFERKFNLADHVNIIGAKLNNGLLTIDLVREIPEEMRPRVIPINTDSLPPKHQPDTAKAA